MNLDTQFIGSTTLVTVNAQRIDAAACIQFKDDVRRINHDPSGRFVLNLQHVTFIDSSGLGAIVAVDKGLGDALRLELADLQPLVRKVMRLTHLDRVFTIHESAEAALKSNAHAL